MSLAHNLRLSSQACVLHECMEKWCSNRLFYQLIIIYGYFGYLHINHYTICQPRKLKKYFLHRIVKYEYLCWSAAITNPFRIHRNLSETSITFYLVKDSVLISLSKPVQHPLFKTDRTISQHLPSHASPSHNLVAALRKSLSQLHCDARTPNHSKEVAEDPGPVLGV